MGYAAPHLPIIAIANKVLFIFFSCQSEDDVDEKKIRVSNSLSFSSQ